MDAHVDRRGPNRGSLWHARSNFLKFEACDEVARQHVRRPTPDEPKVRHWSLLEDVAVELLPATDVSPWNLLHDGTVVGLKRVGERVAMTVDIPYLRMRFDVSGVGLVLELLGGPEMEYAPYEGDAITSLDAIAKAEPDIVEAKEEDGRVVVWGSAAYFACATATLPSDSKTACHSPWLRSMSARGRTGTIGSAGNRERAPQEEKQ